MGESGKCGDGRVRTASSPEAFGSKLKRWASPRRMCPFRQTRQVIPKSDVASRSGGGGARLRTMTAVLAFVLIGITASITSANETGLPAASGTAAAAVPAASTPVATAVPAAPDPAVTAAPSPPSDPLADARGHLERGELDEVWLLLEEAKLSSKHFREAATLLADAASDALDRRDPFLALTLAQASLRYDGKEPLALATAARASLGLQQVGSAKDYIRRFVALRSRSPMAKLLSAEDAFADRDWNRTLDHLRGLKTETFNEMDALRVEELWHESTRELAELRAERQIRSAAPRAAAFRTRRATVHFRQHVNPERIVRRRSCGR